MAVTPRGRDESVRVARAESMARGRRLLSRASTGEVVGTRPGHTFAAVAVVVSVVLAHGPSSAGDNCNVAALRGLGIKDLTITSASTVAAANGAPAFCQVSGSVVTNGEGAGPGSAGLQLVLPANWNGKFHFVGGGGFDGLIRGVESPQNLMRG